LVRKLEEKRSFEGLGLKLEGNIKMDLKETGCGQVSYDQ
jgi:hypothetical protein